MKILKEKPQTQLVRSVAPSMTSSMLPSAQTHGERWCPVPGSYQPGYQGPRSRFALPTYVEEPRRPAPPSIVPMEEVTPYNGNQVYMGEYREDEKKCLDRMSACIEMVIQLLSAQQLNAQQAGRKNIIGLKIDQTLPLLRDSDADFEGHWRQFQSVLDCYGKCGAQLSSYETLIMYRRCLPNGCLRLKTFDNELKKARNRGRLPDDADKVSEEVWAKLADLLKESGFQRKGRLDKEMDRLEMGKRSHAEFRVDWEILIENQRQAGMLDTGPIGTDNLMRKYISKISESLRVAIMGKTHYLDGPNKAPRECVTWEEVADAVGWELEARGDVKAPKEQLFQLEDTPGGNGTGLKPKKGAKGDKKNQGTNGTGSPTQPTEQPRGRRGIDYPHDESYSLAEKGQKVRCQTCKRPGHWPEQCPQLAASRRSNTAKYIADYERTGRYCGMCGYADHRDEDHRNAER